jgi:branched-chain amino acid aminotransferase
VGAVPEPHPSTTAVRVPLGPLPPAAYRDGVAVALVHGLHREDPLTKRADFVAARRRFETGAAVEEHLIVDDEGRNLEGFSSSFYAVREGVLRIARQGVLAGTTRRMVLRSRGGWGSRSASSRCSSASFPTARRRQSAAAHRGVVPLVRIDGAPLGTGRPGPVVTRLVETYAAHAAAAVRRATDTA